MGWKDMNVEFKLFKSQNEENMKVRKLTYSTYL